MKHFFLLSALTLSCAQALSSEATSESPKAAQPSTANWAGSAELGFIETSGNSDTQSLNGKFDISREKDALKTALKTEALTSKENGNASKEKYTSEIKVDYSLDEFDYLTSTFNYEDDRFSAARPTASSSTFFP